MSEFLQDIRYGLRAISKSPGFAAALLLTLMIGIGANTAIFSVMNAVLLRPLPYANPDRLVVAWTQFLQAGISENSFSVAELDDLIKQNRTLEKVAAYQATNVNLTGVAEPERIPAALATADFFSVLGVRPTVGRAFLPEDVEGKKDVILLSHGLWQRKFGSDPGVVGRALSLNGKQNVILGVMPAGFAFPKDADIWKLLTIDPKQQESRGDRYLDVVARLKEGVSLEQSKADARVIGGRLLQAYPESYPKDSGWGIVTVSMQEQQIGDFRTTLFVWLGAVGLVLLVACTNIVNLLLAKSLAREREFSIRAALGAGRLRLIRQFVTETLVLSVLGGLLSLLLAHWGLRFLLGIYPQAVPRTSEIGLDSHVLLFTFGLSIVVGLVLGFIPVLKLVKIDLIKPLREGTKSTAHEGPFGVRNLLVVAEVALALILLVGAILLIRTLSVLQEVNPGFKPDHVLTAQVTLPTSKYPEARQGAMFFQQLLERLARSPRVVSAGAVSNLPFSDTDRSNSLYVDGHPLDPNAVPPEAGIRRVSTGYFKTLAIPLLKGRSFSDADRADAPPAVVVDEVLAKSTWPGQDPLGKRVSLEGPTGPWLTVVGVVGNVKHHGLDTDAKMQLYFPMQQSPVRSMFVVLRTQGEPDSLISDLRAEVRALDPDQPVADIAPMENRLDRSLSRRRFSMWLLVAFAGVAVVLAALGIYGVLSFFVAQKTREIGIRMALGARQGEVLKMMVRRGLVLAMVGVGIGLVGGLATTRWMASLLYGVASSDYLTFILVAVLLPCVAALASYLPARRASRVNPIEALKYE